MSQHFTTVSDVARNLIVSICTHFSGHIFHVKLILFRDFDLWNVDAVRLGCGLWHLIVYLVFSLLAFMPHISHLSHRFSVAPSDLC